MANAIQDRKKTKNNEKTSIEATDYKTAKH